jgi:hypothetical protein
MLLFFQCGTSGSLEMLRVIRHEVGQFFVFCMTPPGLDGVQFRGVGWQPLEINVLDSRFCNSFGRRTVNRTTIPADDQGTLIVLAKLRDKGHNLVGANVVLVNLKRRTDVSPRGRESDGSDDAQTVIPVPGTLHGCFATRCPGSAVHRLQPKPGFIDKNNACASPLYFFLMRGQSCFRHRATASGSCSRATCLGFCGLKPSSCRIRPKWSGWYFTPNRLRTSLATRAQVHKSVLNPAANGPASSNGISCCFCFSDSLVDRGGCGLAAKASTPPAFQADFQRFTLERLAPSKRAMVRRGFRSWKYPAARKRRASSSNALPGGLMYHGTVLAPGRVHFTRRDQ